MENRETLSLEQIRPFLEGSGEVRFQAHDRGELYEWVDQTLRQHNYGHLKRESKGLVRRYVSKMTGLSRAQMARLIIDTPSEFLRRRKCWLNCILSMLRCDIV